MIRGYGHYDNFPVKETEISRNPKMAQRQAFNWPTIDEMLEATAMERHDTFLQILRGQAYYFGYECERFVENEIPINYKVDVVEKLRQNVITENIKVSLAKKLMKLSKIPYVTAKQIINNQSKLGLIK